MFLSKYLNTSSPSGLQVDILFGDVNPSGKLPYTVGKSLSDYGEGGQVLYKPNGIIPQQDYKEGLYIDYRHFDKVRVFYAQSILCLC